MQARCCCDSQNALVQGGAILRCHKQASDNALMVQKGCAVHAAVIAILRCSMHAAAVVIHRMLWWKKVCYPALPCKLAAVDPQNALVQEGCISRNAML
jgi:hypothetical protein